MTNTSITSNFLLFHQVIQPKLRRRALCLARGCEFTAAELLAGAADLFSTRHLEGGDYTDAQLVLFGGLLLLENARNTGVLRRKDTQAEPVCLVPLQDADQHPAADQVEQHRDTRLALLERALEQKNWVEPALAVAIERIWEGATIAETAQGLGLTASGLHKKLRRLGRQLLAGERPVQRGNKGSQRREAAGQMDLFSAAEGV